MRVKILLRVLISLLVFSTISFAQMKTQIPANVKPPALAKTYWCAEVKDILFSKDPQEGQKLSVGVRINFTKRTIIPGAPGQKVCDCGFEGPSGTPTKFWSKILSLRLIGIKYSATETNLLEYYGPTPAFPPYDYGGFPVIGFVVTENDLNRGYIDVWGWTSKEPLQCRDAAIYASLAVYNQSPYNQQNECHPHPDFKKSFKPKCGPIIKPSSIVKTYYCANIEDIFIHPNLFSTDDKISAGVRIRFTKQNYTPGVPGLKLCNCAFEGPSEELTRVWTKTISLRLIGLKYSETETNVLEYYGPTPAFPIYTYSGFQVIGVTITQGDLKEGVKDVWGWAPKKNPLNDNREFKIYVTLDVNGYALKGNDDPNYLKEGCFPSGDFMKSFKPRTLKVPKVSEEKIIKNQQVKAKYEKELKGKEKDDPEKEITNAIFSIGLSAPSFGNDPCHGGVKTTGGLKKYNTENISLGKLPSKPTTSVGKQGQVMEGEDVYTAENVCYEAYDSQGNKCLEATANPDGTTTFKTQKDISCSIPLGDGSVFHISANTEATFSDKQLHEMMRTHNLSIWGQIKKWIEPHRPAPPPTKTAIAGVRGNCDPYGITGGCRVDKGSAWVVPSWLNPMDEIKEAEKNGWIENLRWTRVNPSPEGTGPKQGPSSSADRTHPGKSTKSGYEKEKSSKVDKGETIINPSESSSTGGAGHMSVDLCGRHLPTPEQAAAMSFDPGRITDPAGDWTGRIEQQGTERTLTWSKTVTYTNNGSAKIEKSYYNGDLTAIKIQFFDQKGDLIGIVSYDAKTGILTAQRF